MDTPIKSIFGFTKIALDVEQDIIQKSTSLEEENRQTHAENFDFTVVQCACGFIKVEGTMVTIHIPRTARLAKSGLLDEMHLLHVCGQGDPDT